MPRWSLTIAQGVVLGRSMHALRSNLDETAGRPVELLSRVLGASGAFDAGRRERQELVRMTDARALDARVERFLANVAAIEARPGGVEALARSTATVDATTVPRDAVAAWRADVEALLGRGDGRSIPMTPVAAARSRKERSTTRSRSAGAPTRPPVGRARTCGG